MTKTNVGTTFLGMNKEVQKKIPKRFFFGPCEDQEKGDMALKFLDTVNAHHTIKMYKCFPTPFKKYEKKNTKFCIFQLSFLSAWLHVF